MSLALEAKRVEYAAHQKGSGSGGEDIPESTEVSRRYQEERFCKRYLVCSEYGTHITTRPTSSFLVSRPSKSRRLQAPT